MWLNRPGPQYLNQNDFFSKSGSYKQTLKNEKPGAGLALAFSGKRKQVPNTNLKFKSNYLK